MSGYISGNILLTDHEFVILGVLRPRLNVDVENKVMVREVYDLSEPKSIGGIPTNEEISLMLANAAPTDNLKKLLIPHCAYGPALLEHLLLANHNVQSNTKKKDFGENIDAGLISAVLQEAQDFLVNNKAKGVILQKVRLFSTFFFVCLTT